MENAKEGLKGKGGKKRNQLEPFTGIGAPLCTYVIPLTLVMAYSLFCETFKQHILIPTLSKRLAKESISRFRIREGVQNNVILGLCPKTADLTQLYTWNGQICHINTTLFFFH